MITLYLTDNPDETLRYASLGPVFSDAYQAAQDGEDWDAVDRLDAEQDAMADAYGAVYERHAPAVAEGYDVEVDVLVTRDAASAHDHFARNGGERDDRPDIIDHVWQAIHDEIAVEVGRDGTWTIS